MRTYAEAKAAARPGKAFSNGTEGYAWTGEWCDTCIHDKHFRDTGDGPGCPLFALSLVEDLTPSEWLEQSGPPYTLGDQYHCVEYRDEDDPGPGYENPSPPDPNQLELFEAELWRRPARMWMQPTPDLAEATR